jgi:ABC-type spermidine/putrescine transport system permease subunit I
VTTVDRAADWKVTVGYRMLLRVGWGVFALAVYGAIVALVVGAPGAWWMAAGLAVLALLVVAFLPEPVPAEMLTGRRTRIDTRRPVE